MDKSPPVIPELNEELWIAWVQKGRRGDASRARRWYLVGTIAVATAGFVALYPLLFR